MKKDIYRLIGFAMVAGFFVAPAHADFTLLMRDLTGGSDGNPNSTTEAETIIALEAPSAAYQYTDYTNSPDPDTINVAGGGSFSPTDPLPNGTSAADRYVLRATANLVIPAGDWTIAFGRDDGGYIRIGDGFPGFIDEYSTNGDPTSGDSEIYFNGTGGHAWTLGTFTLASPLVTTLDALMFESGGGDSWELAFASGHKSSFNTTDFSLLQDEVHGWTVQVASIMQSPIGFTDLGTSNITTTTAWPYATITTNVTTSRLVWDTSDKGYTNLASWAGNSGDLGAQTPGARVTHNVSSLTADTQYFFRFYGADAATNGWSAAGTFATDLTSAQTPAFTSAVATFASVTLGWDDNADTESGYVLRRSTNGVDYAVVANLAAATTSHTDDGLLSEKAYYYQLAATNDLNESGTAFAACVTNATTLFMPAVTTYSGEGGAYNKDTWNNAANWDAGVPSASQSAVIATGQYASVAKVYSGVDTPVYTGDLTLQPDADLELGSSANASDYNALGTPGSTTIFMHEGAYMTIRGGRSPIWPALQLLGNAGLNIGTSTGASSDPQFDHGISGPYTLTIRGKSGCDMYLTASNNFSALATDYDPWTPGGFNIWAQAANSLPETVTMDVNAGGANTAVLIIDSANAMPNTGVLTLNGNSATKLTMNANDTIGSLTLNGYAFPTGTYGSDGHGSVDHEASWISGTSVLTVATAPAAPAAPSIQSLSPSNGTANAYAWRSLVATFDHEFILLETGNITIKNLTDGTQDVIPVDDPQISIVGTDLIINPTEHLPKGKDYAIRIDATAIVDPWSQNFAGIANDTTWSFSVSEDPNAHLVAYWPLNDGTNGQLVSAAGGADDLIDDPDHDATDATVSGNDLQTWVYDADPKRDRIVLSTVHGGRLFAGYTEMNMDFTWAVWAKSADSSSAGSLLGTRSGTYARLYMSGCHSDGYGISFNFTTNSALDGKWHHLVLRREENTFSGYVDGQFDSSLTRSKGDNRMMFEIGGTSSYPGDFIGYMSDAAIWEEALTEERIAELAAGGPVIIPPPGGSVFIVR